MGEKESGNDPGPGLYSVDAFASCVTAAPFPLQFARASEQITKYQSQPFFHVFLPIRHILHMWYMDKHVPTVRTLDVLKNGYSPPHPLLLHLSWKAS